MKSNKGITLVTVVLTVVILAILAAATLGVENNIIKQSQLETLVTNMLLIKGKGKEYIEHANFNLGTSSDPDTDRINSAINELKGSTKLEGEELQKIKEDLNISESDEDPAFLYYYKLNETDLEEMGISKVKSDDKNGWYIIKYDIKNAEVEIYHTKGYEKDKKTCYSLTDMQKLDKEYGV